MNYEKMWLNYTKSLAKNSEGGIEFNPIDFARYIHDLIINGVVIENYTEIIDRHKVTLLKKGTRAADLQKAGIIMVEDIPKLVKELLKK